VNSYLPCGLIPFSLASGETGGRLRLRSCEYLPIGHGMSGRRVVAVNLGVASGIADGVRRAHASALIQVDHADFQAGEFCQYKEEPHPAIWVRMEAARL
jgi:hypothetical protein